MSKQAVERVLQLFDALAGSERGLTRGELRWSITEYRDAPSEVAFERMFERDKATLRNLGLLDPALLEQGISHRYRLSSDNRRGIRQRVEEVSREDPSLLLVAWGMLALKSGPWAKVADSVLSKLGWSRRGIELAVGVQNSIFEASPSLLTVLEACVSNRFLTFNYLDGRSDVSVKRILVMGVGNRYGRWYVAGSYVDDFAVRVFRLDRMDDVVLEGPNEKELPEFSMRETLERIDEVPPLGLLIESENVDSSVEVLPAYVWSDALSTAFRREVKFLEDIPEQTQFPTFRLSQQLQRVAALEQKKVLKVLRERHEEFRDSGGVVMQPPPRSRLRANTEMQVAELMALTQLALDNPGISFSDLAQRTGLSTGTVKKRLNTLWVNLGENSFHLSVENDRIFLDTTNHLASLPPFSALEVAVVCLVLDFLRTTSLQEDDIRQSRERWLELTACEELSERLYFFSDTPKYEEIRSAISCEEGLDIEYPQKDGREHRQIRPLGMFRQRNRVYLSAYCFRRTAFRVFRVDRLSITRRFKLQEDELQVTDQAEIITPQEWVHSLKTSADTALIAIHASLSPEMEMIFQQSAVEVSTQNGMDYLRIAIPSQDWMWEQILHALGAVEVLEPLSLRNYILNRVKELEELLSKTKNNELPAEK